MEDFQAQIDEDSQRWFPEKNGNMPFTVLALAGEAGELANIVKKVERGDFPVTPEVHGLLCGEVVDVFIYTVQIANCLGIDILEAYKIKREYNESRFGHPAKGAPEQQQLIIPGGVQRNVRPSTNGKAQSNITKGDFGKSREPNGADEEQPS